jgi:hypothetical protein
MTLSCRICAPAFLALLFLATTSFPQEKALAPAIILPKADGFRGIWFADMASNDEYRYVYYSGGLGTYTADHIPMAYYANEVHKTFFCWGGSAPDDNRLLLMVSAYDHRTGTVERPGMLMDRRTDDAHDNPVLTVDEKGYVWVFVSSHGTTRPSYIYRSGKPYSLDSFSLIRETNFSYPQPWHIPGKGFLFLHTRYIGGRHLYFSTSPDGFTWTEPEKLSTIAQGHYQISWMRQGRVGTAFNYHPNLAAGNWDNPEKPGDRPRFSGANNRTNLYYLYTDDLGKKWRNAGGEPVAIPLTEPDNAALVREYAREGLLVYTLDMDFDSASRPVILYITSRGSESGPQNDPRTWTVAHWTGKEWEIRPVTTSDNNYDMGSIFVEPDGTWRIIGPTGNGPQSYNCGGEVVLWTSRNRGQTWKKERQVTAGSEYNHSYVRKPVQAHPDFYAFWADGNGRAPSPSRLYFCDKTGKKVYRLPESMGKEREKPIVLTP